VEGGKKNQREGRKKIENEKKTFRRSLVGRRISGSLQIIINKEPKIFFLVFLF